ncbi:TonB-dependent siderophore receptor [Arcobacter sp. 15-2]|uniref:TonB-dependent siderophore receptor n=1 Tax=Arcobacter sp. 15-2 TaxID=3374109 RepID=UPI00399C9614
MKKNKVIGLSLYAILALQVAAFGESVNALESVDVISSDEKKESYTVESMSTSTKLNLSIKDTPQSVSVFTRQKLDDLGINSYSDMLANVTGVTLDRWDERLHSSARGFVIDYYKIDGMPTYNAYNDRDLDLSMYERVEIVKGANGLTTGAGNPGMSINLVRKKANSKDLKGTLKLEAGSWDSYGATVDIGSSLNKNETIRGRVVLKHKNSNSFMDKYNSENNLFYGVIDADLSDNTNVSVGVSYQEINKNGIRWGGLPAYHTDGTFTNFDRSKTVSEDWTYWDTEIISVFTDLKHNFANGVSLNTNYSYNEISKDTALLYFTGAVDKATGAGTSSMDWEASEEKKEHDFDINVNIPFELGGLEQEIIIGTTYNLSKQTKYDARYPNGYYDSVANFYNYNISLPSNSNTDVPYVVEPEQIEQKAIYLAGKFQVTDEVKVIAGTRLSSYKYTSDDNSKDTRKFSEEITPYLGFVYDLNKEHSLYTSYTSIFKPQDNKDANGDYLDPIKGDSLEAGIKGEYLDETLNASLSLFRTKQDNIGQDTGRKTLNNETIYEATAGVISKGIEIDISGKITDNFSIDFGVANFSAKDKDDEKYNTKASRTTANIFAKYKFKDFVFGAGLNYKSKYYVEVAGKETITQEAFYLVNAMTSYDINNNLKVQLNIHNLMDKKYYEGIGSNSMVYGSPRNFTATLKYSF